MSTAELTYRTNGRNRGQDREQTASRLLRSSAVASFDPTVDVDWDAPEDPDQWFMQPERTSLYGTPLWDRMSLGQRRELTRHELASIASSGIFFEMVLMRMLLRHLGRHDITSSHFQYGLTEVADECRHSTMFGDLVTWLGTPAYGPGKKVRLLAEMMHTPISNDALAFAGTYYVEAVLDAIQKEGAADERCQELTRRVAHIHVVEEARHMRYADEELARDLADMSRLDRERVRVLLPTLVRTVNDVLIHPRVYGAVGLDIDEALQARARNPRWRETLRWAARKPMAIFHELELIGGPTKVLWRQTGLL